MFIWKHDFFTVSSRNGFTPFCITLKLRFSIALTRSDSRGSSGGPLSEWPAERLSPFSAAWKSAHSRLMTPSLTKDTQLSSSIPVAATSLSIVNTPSGPLFRMMASTTSLENQPQAISSLTDALWRSNGTGFSLFSVPPAILTSSNWAPYFVTTMKCYKSPRSFSTCPCSSTKQPIWWYTQWG